MKLKIVKIGGYVLNDKTATIQFIKKFKEIKGKKILVHGGGRKATDLAKKLNVDSPIIEGRRVTNAEMLDIVTMVYSGLNKELVAKLNAEGEKAIGLSGADLNILPAKKRENAEIDYGFVGDIKEHKIKTDSLEALLNANITPVFAPLSYNKSTGTLLNTNADTIAQSLAVALSSKYDVELIYAFEKNGVLQDAEDNFSVINNIDKKYYQDLILSKIIINGMIPKMNNAFSALEKGVRFVRITNYLHLKQGTVISL